MPSRRVLVRVPASTSNLGPGFDALGLALGLQTSLIAETADVAELSIRGEGAATLPRGPDNLIVRRMAQLAELLGRELPPLRLEVISGIPLERGLGASGAATLCGLLAANALLDGALDRQAMLELAVRLEGHPDNVTPSLLGGCTVSAIEGQRVITLHVPWSDSLRVALCVPELEMQTAKARALLPPTYSRADAAYNIQRTGLLVAALAGGSYDALRIAVEDRLHQPYRTAMFPALPDLIAAAHDAGAYGAFLSGAGSTVAAITGEARADAVAAAMSEAARRNGLDCRSSVSTVDYAGATVQG